jgi:putative nucleotide binding protein
MRGQTGDEEWLIVLATQASSSSPSDHSLVQGVGTKAFPLVDVTVSNASDLSWGDRLYVGPGAWDRVQQIERQLTCQQLSPAVQGVLWPTVAGIIRRNERRFIEYFNTTTLDGLASHPLSLLPSLSAECREAIIAARHERRFADFNNLTARVDCLEQPRELLVERVLFELRAGEDTYHWLTALSAQS